MDTPFSEWWHIILEEAEALTSAATLVTPLSDTRYHRGAPPPYQTFRVGVLWSMFGKTRR